MKNVELLKNKARWVRLQVLESINRAGKGHIGGTFSCVDILTALYYGKFISSAKSLKPNRDKFILSKGHACLGLYAILWDLRIISKKKYLSYGEDGGLGGQLDVGTDGVDFNTGSLGHAIGVGCGMALASKKTKKKNFVYVLLGDAELFEGSVWEAVIFASEVKINNLICIIDRNRFMVTDSIEDGSIYKDLKIKLIKFGWDFFEIDGHNIGEIINTLKKAKVSDKPVMIIANTIKGKGVSFMESSVGWYTQTPSGVEYLRAKKELTRGI